MFCYWTESGRKTIKARTVRANWRQDPKSRHSFSFFCEAFPFWKKARCRFRVCYLDRGDILRGVSERFRPVNTFTLAFKITAATITTKKDSQWRQDSAWRRFKSLLSSAITFTFPFTFHCRITDAWRRQRTNGWLSIQRLFHPLHFIVNPADIKESFQGGKGTPSPHKNQAVTQFRELDNCVIFDKAQRAQLD